MVTLWFSGAPVVDKNAWIFARGGSRRVPGKNIAEVGGRPLIAWAVAHALNADIFDEVFVSTDSPEIAEIAEAHGARSPFLRPPELSAGDSNEMDAWRHALNWEIKAYGRAPEVFVSVPTTAPLREPSDIVECVDALHSSQADIVLTVTPATHLPRYNMVSMDHTRRLRLLDRSPVLEGAEVADSIFNVTTVCYSARAQYVLRSRNLFSGRIAGLVIPQERALDIDTPFDLKVADLLLSDRRERERGRKDG